MQGVRSFNIPVRDMARAIGFYHNVFGWDIGAVQGSGGEYHLAKTTETDESGVPLIRGFINGGLFEKGTHGVSTTFLEVEVGSIDEALRQIKENGGSII